jgi:hypothetical protein
MLGKRSAKAIARRPQSDVVLYMTITILGFLPVVLAGSLAVAIALHIMHG